MTNPYSPPLAAVEGGGSSEARQIRVDHIQHEASIRSFGLVFVLGGLVGAPASFAIGISAVQDGELITGRPDEVVLLLVLGVLLFLLSAAQLWTGVGMRRLDSRSRVPAAILAGVACLNVPVGTLVGLYMIYLVVSAKGKMVMSAEYAHIRSQTTDIRPRTSVLSWVVLSLLVALIVTVFVVAAL